MWLYGSGFPKSMNIGLAIDKKLGNESKVIGIQTVPDIRGDAFGTMNEKQGGSYKNITRDIKEAQNEWKGWGTCLKPSYEPIIVARKPFKGSLVDNVLENGVGGLNIDECRIPTSEDDLSRLNKEWDHEWNTTYSNFAEKIGGKSGFGYKYERVKDKGLTGRFPANTILDTREGEEWRRYFYCAKASKKDRDEGLEEFMEDTTDDGRNKPIDNPYLRGKTMRHNTHPTVKPTTLMQYLIRLVAPNGATILDPFMGSGSTGKAVIYENKERDAGYKFIGIEKDPEYCEIAKARIEKAKEGRCKLI
jgi:site-specific DNA-methyltransferase (adenine-specific)